jgi:hypothetical protein
LEPKKADSEQT